MQQTNDGSNEGHDADFANHQIQIVNVENGRYMLIELCNLKCYDKYVITNSMIFVRYG